MKNKIALIVAVVLGLIAVYGVRQYLGREQEKFKKTFRTVRVAVAAERIKAGTAIRPNMISYDEIPEKGVTQDHVLATGADWLVGQTIIRTVERGDQLLFSYFRQPVEKLEQRLHTGERALTLRVDAVSGVAGNIVPGSHVDIVGTFPVAAASGKAGAPAAPTGAVHAVPLLSNVTILAVDNRTREEEYVSMPGGSRVRAYNSVTVAATPDEANMLIYAQQYGTLTLTLRPPTDSAVPPVPAEITDRNLLETAAQAQKAREERLKHLSPIEVTPANP